MGTKARGGITLYNVKNGKDAESHRLRPQSEKAVVGADNSLYIILSYIIEHVNGAQVTTEAGSAQGYHVTARMNNGVSIAMTNGAVNSGTYKLTNYSKALNRPDYVIIELRDSADKVVDIRTAQIIMEASSYVDIVADLRTTVSQHGDSISTIKQTANSVSATITSLKNGLETVGMHLDGENSTFDIVADTFKVVTTTGKVSFFTSGGKLNADFIDAKAIVAKGIKAQTIDAEGATFQNITVTGKSKFGGELIGASGSFTQLNCVDTDSRVVASLRFSPEGRMVFDGDISSQGSKNVNGRNRALRYYASDIWCRGQFGHHSRTCVVVKDDMMYVHHSGHEYTDGLKIILERVTTRTGKEVYVIPLYSPGVAGSWGNNGEVVDYDNPKINELYSDPYKRENAEQLELPAGAPIDVVVFNCTRECLYKFVGMNNGKQWTVINGNDYTSVTICCHGGAFDVHGGYVLDCCYVNPVWLSPSSVDATSPGAGVMVGREMDMNWR